MKKRTWEQEKKTKKWKHRPLKKYHLPSYVEDEYQVYKVMKWDYEHGQLSVLNKKRFEKLKEKYEKED